MGIYSGQMLIFPLNAGVTSIQHSFRFVVKADISLLALKTKTAHFWQQILKEDGTKARLTEKKPDFFFVCLLNCIVPNDGETPEGMIITCGQRE